MKRPDLVTRLWPFVRPYRSGFGLCLALLAVSFVVELLGPWIIRRAIDGPLSHRGDGAPGELALLVLGFAATAAIGAGLGWVYGLRTAWNGLRVVRDVRRALFDHMLGLPQGFYDKHPKGQLTTRITTDVENLHELIATGVLQTLFDLLKIVGVLTVLFFLDVRLGWYALAATPIVVALSLAFRGRASRAFGNVRKALGDQNGTTAELIGGIRAVRVFGRTGPALERFDAANRRTARGWLETVACFSLFFALVDGALRLVTVGLLYVGAQAVTEGVMPLGAFAQFWLYFGLLTGPIKELGEKYNILQAAHASARWIFEVLDEAPFPGDAPGTATPVETGTPELAFERVRFAYEREPVLRGIDLTAPPGTTTAIVGPTGAGKSTLLSMIPRFLDPDEGRLAVAGTNLRDLAWRGHRRRIALVPQDVFLFAGTVLDNLRLFDRRIPLARVEAALDQLDLQGWVEALPERLETRLHELGAGLAAGQRQLLAMARAVLRDPEILILDEATSSLDSETERRLQTALARLCRDRTVFVVAHRLATVRHADQILVMDRGAIVERGRHAELVARNGTYAAMLRSGLEGGG